MNAEMFFLAALALGGEIAAKFIHLAAGLAAAVGIYGYARRYVGIRAATVAAVSFLAAPSVVWLLGFAYIDLFLSLLLVGAVVAFTAYAVRGNTSWAPVMGFLMAGFIGSKFTGLPIMVLFAFGMLVLLRKRKVPSGTAVKTLAKFVLIALVLGSPWLVRNAVWTGNPVFPFIWGENEFWDDIERHNHVTFIRNYGYGHRDNPLERYGMLPWNLSINAAFSYYPADNYDGVIGPLLLILLPIMIFARKNAGLRAAALLMLGGFLMYAFTTNQLRFFLPWLGPFLVLGIVSASSAGPRYASAAFAFAAAIAIINLLVGFSIIHQQYPLRYVLGLMDRDAFLERKLKGEYKLYRAMNNLKPDSRTLLVHGGNFGYWAERPFIHDSFFEAWTLRKICIEGRTPEGVLKGLQKLGVTHLGVQHLYLDMDVKNEPEAFAPLRGFIERYALAVWREGPMVIYELINEPGSG
jgi:4-amino-4-deoxy-L-arabinose transferase-like glycosyltransferase